MQTPINAIQTFRKQVRDPEINSAVNKNCRRVAQGDGVFCPPTDLVEVPLECSNGGLHNASNGRIGPLQSISFDLKTTQLERRRSHARCKHGLNLRKKLITYRLRSAKGHRCASVAAKLRMVCKPHSPDQRDACNSGPTYRPMSAPSTCLHLSCGAVGLLCLANVHFAPTGATIPAARGCALAGNEASSAAPCSFRGPGSAPRRSRTAT